MEPEARAPRFAPDEQVAPRASWLERAQDLQRWRAGAWLLIAGLTVVRLFALRSTGLTHTEAYYYSWSRFPSWSYYDHPPLVAWMTWLSTLGQHDPLAIRAGVLACVIAFSALLFELTARLFSPRAGLIAVAVVSVLPVFVISGLLANPEAPLAPLWMLSLLLLDDMRLHREGWRPLALGAAIGVGFLAKYTAVLLVPIALAYLVTSSTTRHWLRRPSLYAGGLVALLFASPVVWWNASRGWPSLALHLSERVGEASWETFAARGAWALFMQWSFLHPLVMPALLAMGAVLVWRAPRDHRARLLALAGVPAFLFFVYTMARVSDAESHWTMMASVPLAMGLAGALDEGLRRRATWARAHLVATLTTGAGFIALALVHLRTSEVIPLFAQVPSYDPMQDPVGEVYGWHEVASAISDEADRMGQDAVVASTHNVLCGRVLAEIDDHPDVYCLSPRRTAYDFVGRGGPPPGAPLLLVESARYPLVDPARVGDRTCRPVRTLEVARAGIVVARYRLSACVAGS